MDREKAKEKRDKKGCEDFGSAYKGFQEMFEKMRECCTGQEGSIDCCAMMGGFA